MLLDIQAKLDQLVLLDIQAKLDRLVKLDQLDQPVLLDI